MFMITDIVDGGVLKLEYSVSQDPIAMYGNQTIGSTYRGQESLLVKAGQMVKHILQIRSAKQFKKLMRLSMNRTHLNLLINQKGLKKS